VLFVCLPQLEDTVSDDERYGDEDDPGIGICIGLSGPHLEVCMRSQCCIVDLTYFVNGCQKNSFGWEAQMPAPVPQHPMHYEVCI